jgi:hypothetical protein
MNEKKDAGEKKTSLMENEELHHLLHDLEKLSPEGRDAVVEAALHFAETLLLNEGKKHEGVYRLCPPLPGEPDARSP